MLHMPLKATTTTTTTTTTATTTTTTTIAAIAARTATTQRKMNRNVMSLSSITLWESSLSLVQKWNLVQSGQLL